MAPTPDITPLEPQSRGDRREVRRTRAGDVLVLSPQGLLAPEHLDELEHHISAVDGPVVIDMGDCMLGRTDLLLRIDPARWARRSEEMCLVCRRYSARLLLARAGVAQRIAVFGSLEDALRSRARADADGRSGWAR